MMLSNVEHALGMMRIYLVECATRNDWNEHRTDELAQTIVDCLRQSMKEPRQDQPERDRTLSHDALRRAIRFVNDNLDSKLKWDEIAADVGLDPFSFGRRFKRSTGMTPHQYIIRCRLRKAMKLLGRGGLSLADIALEVGCSCQSHLTALFRRHLGTTPGAFRMLAREGQQPVRQFFAAMTSSTPNRRMLLGQRPAVAVARVQAQ